jgi:hypothetical protein
MRLRQVLINLIVRRKFTERGGVDRHGSDQLG